MIFEIYREKRMASAAPADWRWRLLAKNGEIIADSAEGYRNEGDCRHDIDLVRNLAPDTPIKVLE